MGLDMWLHKEQKNGTPGKEIKYWRKANAIHGYFIDRCHGGVDDQQPIVVNKDVLADLVGRCKEVLADHSLADDKLPTMPGFFFGNTDYDEWYYQDLEETVQALEPVIAKAKPDARFIYSCWW